MNIKKKHSYPRGLLDLAFPFPIGGENRVGCHYDVVISELGGIANTRTSVIAVYGFAAKGELADRLVVPLRYKRNVADDKRSATSDSA